MQYIQDDVLQTATPAIAPARRQANTYSRILVVDDDAAIRQVNSEVLIRMGYQADSAANGASAWEALQAKAYDLLITDNDMPKVSGGELVRKLRSAHMTLPVILASETVPAHELDRNQWLQPVATLVKPFSSGPLLETHYWRISVRTKWLVKPISGGRLLATVSEFLAQPTIHEARIEVLPAAAKGVKLRGSTWSDQKTPVNM